MRNIKAIFIKQLMSYIKNPQVYALPLMLLGFVVVFSMFSSEQYAWEFANMFAPLFLGMAMVGAASSFIWEDRLTMNLRFMAMAGMRPYQYLIGTGGALMVAAVVFLTMFGILGRYSVSELFVFLPLTILGAMTSVLLGITLALAPHKFRPVAQTIPFLLGFGSILAEANENVAGMLYFVFNRQIQLALDGMMEYGTDPTRSFYIVAANIVVVLIAFIVMHRKNGLEGQA